MMQPLDGVRTLPSSNDLQAETPEADQFYGLAPGFNGTAAETRRCVVEIVTGPGRWLRHDGSPAAGLFLRGEGGAKFRNPWSGR
jgi:hypothetical protein